MSEAAAAWFVSLVLFGTPYKTGVTANGSNFMCYATAAGDYQITWAQDAADKFDAGIAPAYTLLDQLTSDCTRSSSCHSSSDAL